MTLGSPGDDAYVTSVARLSEAAGYMGLAGVQRIGACVLDNLQHLDADDQDARVLVRPFFTEWAAAARSAPARRRPSRARSNR